MKTDDYECRECGGATRRTEPICKECRGAVDREKARRKRRREKEAGKYGDLREVQKDSAIYPHAK
jgi:predicted amidophosphoribosyltransferase